MLIKSKVDTSANRFDWRLRIIALGGYRLATVSVTTTVAIATIPIAVTAIAMTMSVAIAVPTVTIPIAMAGFGGVGRRCGGQAVVTLIFQAATGCEIRWFDAAVLHDLTPALTGFVKREIISGSLAVGSGSSQSISTHDFTETVAITM
jgi:hypothetical protein